MEFANEQQMFADWRWSHMLSAGRLIQPTSLIAV